MSDDRSAAGGRLRAADAWTVEDEVHLCLQNASRVNPDGSYRRRFRELIEQPEVLDYLERASLYWRISDGES